MTSQAVGPPLSDFEMSFVGRTFPKIGKKMISLQPLAKQQVHPEDSALGTLALWPQQGPSASYEELIQQAFQPQWWESDLIITEGVAGNLSFTERPPRPLTTDEFSMIEYNFSLFFGLAVQMYGSTLISDDTPFDRFMDGDDIALTEQQQKGLGIFEGKAHCSECHGGRELTTASVGNVMNERFRRTNTQTDNATFDNGFFNIGVRPTDEDAGVGGIDPFGNSLSESRLAQQGLISVESPDGEELVGPDERIAVDGAFKTPGLRNVELTAPYFHNGGQLTLRQVAEFYNRGADFHEQNIDILPSRIKSLGLDEENIDALVAFLMGLTDERLRLQKAPFESSVIRPQWTRSIRGQQSPRFLRGNSRRGRQPSQ